MRKILLLLALALPALAEPPLRVHVTVALCDNASQGIVPVPAAIGDGDDPRTNLYWGAMYGVKSWLKRPRSIVLACISRRYFAPYLARAGSPPLLLTNGLMAPEAYTLTAAIEAFVKKTDVADAAARAYDNHQKCGLKAARKLFQAK